MPYQRKDVAAPRLAGGPLKLFAKAVNTPGLGGVLRGQMLAQVGIQELRSAYVAESTTALRPRFFDPVAPHDANTESL